MKRKAIFGLLLFCPVFLTAQEFHYWNSQIGAKPSMLGGAVTAADNENSAIYYNPGALGFIQNSSLSLSSDTYYFSWVTIENGAGEELDLVSSEFNVFPQIIAYNQKIAKLPITITIAAINRDASFINASYRNEKVGEIIDELPGDEIYVGMVDYYNNLKDNWVGFGYGRKIGNYVGLGFSAFISIRAMEFRYSEDANVYKVLNDSTDIGLVSNVYLQEYLDMRNLGMVFMFGFSYQREKFKMGINVIFPRINMRFIGRSNLRRSYMYNVPTEDTIVTKYTVWQEGMKSTFRTPFTVDLGFELNVSKSTTLYAKASWFAPLGKYAMLNPDEQQSEIAKAINEVNPEFNNIYLANKMVINLALAFQTQVSRQISILGAFATDFNYFDREAFDLINDYYPGITYWDIYHLSGGIVWTKEKFDLSLGGSFSFGRDDSLPQIVNLSDPKLDNNLFGERVYSATAHYNQISFFFGFTYFFPRI